MRAVLQMLTIILKYYTGTVVSDFIRVAIGQQRNDRMVGYTTVFARGPREAIVSLLRQLFW